MAKASSGKQQLAEGERPEQAYRKAPQVQVIETESGFIIRSPAAGASPPGGPARLSRTVNSDRK